jgi:hypothetical protein
MDIRVSKDQTVHKTGDDDGISIDDDDVVFSLMFYAKKNKHLFAPKGCKLHASYDNSSRPTVRTMYSESIT